MCYTLYLLTSFIAEETSDKQKKIIALGKGKWAKKPQNSKLFHKNNPI